MSFDKTLQLRMWPKGEYAKGSPGPSVGYNRWGIENLKQLSKAGKIQLKLDPTRLCVANGTFGGTKVLSNIDAKLEAYLKKQGIWPDWREDEIMVLTKGNNGGYKRSGKTVNQVADAEVQYNKHTLKNLKKKRVASANAVPNPKSTSPKSPPFAIDGNSIRRRLARSERLGRAC